VQAKKSGKPERSEDLPVVSAGVAKVRDMSSSGCNSCRFTSKMCRCALCRQPCSQGHGCVRLRVECLIATPRAEAHTCAVHCAGGQRGGRGSL
jgi:hypothetical protein